MFLCNTTFHVHRTVDNDFHSWVRERYAPAAIASGIFRSPMLSKILVDVDHDSNSYALQFYADSVCDAEAWMNDGGAILRSRLVDKFGERILFFTTYMEVLPL